MLCYIFMNILFNLKKFQGKHGIFDKKNCGKTRRTSGESPFFFWQSISNLKYRKRTGKLSSRNSRFLRVDSQRISHLFSLRLLAVSSFPLVVRASFTRNEVQRYSPRNNINCFDKHCAQHDSYGVVPIHSWSEIWIVRAEIQLRCPPPSKHRLRPRRLHHWSHALGWVACRSSHRRKGKFVM